MRAGKLKKRVVIQKNTPTQDAYGSEVESWATFATRWASVEPLKGQEFFAAQQTDAALTVAFRLRYLAGVTTEMRVSYNSRLFDIHSAINVDERNRELILMCTEAV